MNRSQLKSLIKECINESLYDNDHSTQYTIPVTITVRYTDYTEFHERSRQWSVFVDDKLIAFSTNSEEDDIAVAFDEMFKNTSSEQIDKLLEKSSKLELS